jgi:flavin-dependent dehydrogenase
MDAPELTTGAPTETEADVIVVGAGPAGPAAAGSRARADLHVPLLEKYPSPRSEVREGGFAPRGDDQPLLCRETAG